MMPTPIAPTARGPALPSAVAEAEFIRASYLHTESRLKTLGAWFLLVAGVFTLALAGVLVSRFFAGNRPGWVVLEAFACLVGFLLPWWLLNSGRLLLRLDSAAWKPALALSAFGLLAVPVGTILNIGILRFLLSKKTRFVLSDSYRLAIMRTPHLGSRVSSPFLFFAIGVLLMIAVTTGWAMMHLWATSR
jgi:hypothetical protein